MAPTEKVETLFAENHIGSIATINDDGSPWSTPLHMVKNDNYVYWFSNTDKVHSKNIARDPRVSLSLFCADAARGLRGVYISGRAEQIPDSEHDSAWEMFSSKLGENVPPGMGKSRGYRLPIGEFNAEKSTGNCWYFNSQKD